MMVAVSGTHCCGKSTLIEAFLLAHPDFLHEPEPYAVLEEEYGEAFAAEPTPDDFYRQLEFNIERLRAYRSNQRVIFERSPVDFLAYLLALNDLQRSDSTRRLIESALESVAEALPLLDLIIFLPLNDADGIEVPDEEDAQLRDAVNDHLVDIFNDDGLNLFTGRRPLVLEVTGSTAQRLRLLEGALNR